MSMDLEEQLDEMGPEYRAVVMRLRMAQNAGTREEGTGKRERGRGNRGWLIAASLLVILGLGVFFQTSHPLTLSPSHLLTLSPSHPVIRGAHEYQMDIPEIIATQNPDGSWKNDFLTRRNAAALKACGDPAARIAYKKAARNLRLRGIL